MITKPIAGNEPLLEALRAIVGPEGLLLGEESVPYSKGARDDIYELVVETFHGSYSAEHGIGPHNHAYYLQYTAPAALRLSGHLQRVLDPRKLCGTVQLGQLTHPN